LGNNWEMRGLMLGREAQMMATLHSMADHVAAPTLSSIPMISAGTIEKKEYGIHLQVGSEDFEITSRLFKRMMVVTVTLERRDRN
jgi:hypothetical protein